ncbi:MAG: lipoprotein-releasing ABC transporter ATP-binding protein LolD [bacterium]
MNNNNSNPDPKFHQSDNHSSDIILQCQAVTKQFNDAKLNIDVLKGIDLTVKKGEKIAILGTSGSGKSTLLHILGGLDLPSSGSVSLMGKTLTDLSDAARGLLRNEALGFIYQFHHLLPEFTALENVAMPLLIRGVKVTEAEQKATKMLNNVGLGKRLSHKPAQLSGGERQRAAIARALVSRPHAVLADEPTGNLDYATANKVFNLIQELNEQLQTAFVVVTHDINLAKRMDTVYLMMDGYLKRIEV